MAGTQIVLEISGLNERLLKGHLFFCKSALRTIGLMMEVYEEPDIGEDKLLVCVDGPLEAFTHRISDIVRFLPTFSGAVAELTGNKDLRYSELLIKIFKDCQNHVNDHAEIEKALKAGGKEMKVFVAQMPPELEEIRNCPHRPEYLRIVLEELTIAIKLLHNIPQDYTLALIAADRAIEIYLKGRLSVSKMKFPEMLDCAKNKGVINLKQVQILESAHRARNICQHEGKDVDFYEAVEHVKNIIEVLTVNQSPA